MVGLYFFSKTVIGFIYLLGIVGFPQYVHFWVGFPQYVHFWVWKNPISTRRIGPKTLVNIWFLKEILKTSGTLKGLHSSPGVSTRSSKSSGVVFFFSSPQNGWFGIFFSKTVTGFIRYSWVSTICTLLGWVSTICTLLGLEESNYDF